jgi:uncharacterized RDD family membrane protein YckC
LNNRQETVNPEFGAAIYKSGSPVYAGIARRMMAFWMDLIIIAAFLVLSWKYAIRLAGEDGDFWLLLNLALYSMFFPFVYFVIFHSYGGQTPGKWAFNIMVVEQSGLPAGGVRSVFRAIGYPFSFFFFLAGFIWPIFDPRKQAWHDKIAGTVVLEI